MTAELQWARDAVVEALDAVPYTVPWAFEYSPASTEAVVPGYLRKVREADFLIWLAGSDVTQPVVDEINEALAADKSIVALMLRTEVRSDALQELVGKVRSRTRYRELKTDDPDDLRAELEFAIGDEIVRALRGKPSMGRLARVQELGRASRARIVDKLQAAGVPTGHAVAIADDVTIVSAADARPNADRPLVVLSSPVGAGKSLYGERAHQHDIERYLSGVSEPVPVWLRAADSGDLQASVLSAAEGLGDPRLQGASIIIDGADEAGFAAAAELLSQARVLVRTWPATTALLCTRPMLDIGDEQELAQVRDFTDAEANSLVSRISGQDITQGRAAGFAQPVREAIKRPLFALLLGAALRGGDETPPSRAALIATLVEQASVRAESQAVLRRLAVASLGRGGGPVPTVEVANPREAEELLASRLVVRRSEGLFFPLIIFAHWFAAAAVAEGEVSLEEITSDLGQIDDWLYPFTLCVVRYRSDQVDELLSTLAKEVPGFASRVIDEATSRWGMTDVLALPSLRSARAVRDATAAWVEGIGPLAELIAPLRADGTLSPLGAHASNEHLTLVWYWGTEQRDDVFELPSDFSLWDAGYGWGPGKFARPGAQPAWPWRWSLEDLGGQIQSVLKGRALPVRGTPLFELALYRLVASLNNHGSLTADEFDIAATQAMVEPDTDVVVDRNGLETPVTGLYQDLQVLLDRGQTVLRSPLPGPDCAHNQGGWIWNPYSAERLLERTVAVYSLALEAYSFYVARYFPTLANRMATAATLPAVLKGVVSAPTRDDFGGGPVIRWHFEALPDGEQTRVDLKLSSYDDYRGDGDDGQVEHLRAMRPQAAKWLHHVSRSSVLEVFNAYDPAELAYGWLWADLAGMGWISGSAARRGYSRDGLAIR